MNGSVRLVRPRNDMSLFSHAWSMLSMVLKAEMDGLRAYIDLDLKELQTYRDYYTGEERRGIYYDADAFREFGSNLWDWCFDQPHEVIPDDGMDETRSFIDAEFPCYFKYNTMDSGDVKYKRSIIPRLLRVKQAVLSRSQDLFGSHDLDPHKTIAFLYRANNKCGECVVRPLSAYFSVLDAAVCRYPAFKVWFQTDSLVAVSEFRKRYKDSVSVSHFETINDPRGWVEQFSPRSGYQRAIDAASLMFMLSRCAVLLRNFSNLADMSAALSTGEDIMLL